MDLDGDGDGLINNLWTDDEADVEVAARPVPPNRSIAFLLLLTAGLGGLQFIFALVFSNGSAYLTSLNLSKPVLAIVWTAGPLAGLTLQPYFGVWSDQLGKRRPFIVFGTLGAIISLVGLAFGPAVLNDAGLPVAAQLTGVVFMITLNMAIQPLQGGLRAQLSDACPRAQQPMATALAGTVVSASNVASYLMALVDLPHLLSMSSGSQFAILCTITSVVLALAVALTCLGVWEGRDYVVQPNRELMESSVARLLYLATSLPRLPRQVRQVYGVQFMAWMGWFPFLFYMSTHIAEIYRRGNTSSSALDIDVQAKATRIGSLGLLLFAIVALISGIALPYAHKHLGNDAAALRSPPFYFETVKKWFGSIRRLWLASHLLYAACMFAAFFASSLECVCVLVGLSGVSWSVTIWAPWAIISAHTSHDDGDESVSRLSLIHGYDELEKIVNGPGLDSTREGDPEQCERRPGIAFGLHNAAIAGPQILAAAGCSFIFWVIEGTEQDGVAWALGFGGLAALGAAVLAARMPDETSRPRMVKDGA